ncbi:hypothetical protein J2D73_17140 [Acetobacter sacchari]|uniref:Uncharacterized protein n=1 Tax=Acetobacter sacchari TaxID=2661687 RepID=A0ABS3M020_9PROT|nr:hypothetical protein [Acetobacter sacchari]MBO1361513.1 hypothetical protein [Acetobacter sacchari]
MSEGVKLKQDGTVDASNITAFSTSIAAQTIIFLKLESATAAKYLEHGDKIDQFLMTPLQAMEIADALKNAAQAALSSISGSPMN